MRGEWCRSLSLKEPKPMLSWQYDTTNALPFIAMSKKLKYVWGLRYFVHRLREVRRFSFVDLQKTLPWNTYRSNMFWVLCFYLAKWLGLCHHTVGQFQYARVFYSCRIICELSYISRIIVHKGGRGFQIQQPLVTQSKIKSYSINIVEYIVSMRQLCSLHMYLERGLCESADGELEYTADGFYKLKHWTYRSNKAIHEAYMDYRTYAKCHFVNFRNASPSERWCTLEAFAKPTVVSQCQLGCSRKNTCSWVRVCVLMLVERSTRVC